MFEHLVNNYDVTLGGIAYSVETQLYDSLVIRSSDGLYVHLNKIDDVYDITTISHNGWEAQIIGVQRTYLGQQSIIFITILDDTDMRCSNIIELIHDIMTSPNKVFYEE